MKVEVKTEEIQLVNEKGREQPGVRVTCTRCGFHVDVFGTAEASVKRGCVMLRDDCVMRERNFYQEET